MATEPQPPAEPPSAVATGFKLGCGASIPLFLTLTLAAFFSFEVIRWYVASEVRDAMELIRARKESGWDAPPATRPARPTAPRDGADGS